MSIKLVTNKLFELNSERLSEYSANVSSLLNQTISNRKTDWKCEEFALPYNKLKLPDDSVFWKYISLNLSLLKDLVDILDKTPPDEVLSVQQTKNLRVTFSNIASIGILPNLIPNLVLHKKVVGYDATIDDMVLIRYQRLAASTYGLLTCIKCLKLRYALLPECLQPLLSSLYQIVHCPLKKPNENEFLITKNVYESLLEERRFFCDEMLMLLHMVHKILYVRETMLLLDNSSPLWFKKAVSANLSSILVSEGGLENIAWAMFDNAADYDPDDRTKNWKTLEVITKLVLSLHGTLAFEGNICMQIQNLLQVKRSSGDPVVAFERIFVLCMKNLYKIDEALCKAALIPALYKPFNAKGDFNGERDVSEELLQGVRLLYVSFVEDDVNNECLPLYLLESIIHYLFYAYTVTVNINLKVFNNQLQTVLIKYIESINCKHSLLDSLIFGFSTSDIHVELALNINRIMATKSSHKIKQSCAITSEAFSELIKHNKYLRFVLFVYLLNCLTQQEKYFKFDANFELKTDFVVDEAIERNLVVYKLLSELCEDKTLQKRISDDPKEIIQYIETVLNETIKTNTHKLAESESDSFQSVFTIIMILQALISNCCNASLELYKTLLKPLRIMEKETANLECKDLIRGIVKNLCSKDLTNEYEKCNVTELDKAIQDVCDPLLPIRGHGLITLTKLIEKKDPQAMERKLYILNIFQQNLKNEDSFIYLGAIGGLASMGDVFPEIVLNTLTEEYSDFAKNSEDRNEFRMKLGEVLVRITKLLGDTASKYKTLLLNTFLNGTKDEDQLMRASSLSNLGEVCRVLGYKLGTIVTDVLACVHAIISTDKSVEARRAAVTVIRQLLAGLEEEMVVFLRDEILDVYRTLKNIYYNDEDSVMRLQAQLALEELNENVKKFLLANPQLQMLNKFMLDGKRI